MIDSIYLQAFIGGLMIGLGALVLMLFNGRIAGISGITLSAITSLAKSNWWRWFFLIGVILAPLLTMRFGYGLPSTLPVDLPMLAVSGLLVGIGSAYGSGCTSGHGICGIGRLSKRSIIATLTFMLSAVVTVAIVNHLIG